MARSRSSRRRPHGHQHACCFSRSVSRTSSPRADSTGHRPARRDRLWDLAGSRFPPARVTNGMEFGPPPECWRGGAAAVTSDQPDTISGCTQVGAVGASRMRAPARTSGVTFALVVGCLGRVRVVGEHRPLLGPCGSASSKLAVSSRTKSCWPSACVLASDWRRPVPPQRTFGQLNSRPRIPPSIEAIA